MVSMSNGVGSDSSWTCNVEPLPYWNSIHFNNLAWGNAIETGGNGGAGYPNGVSVTSERSATSNQMYCRKQYGGRYY